MVYDGYGNDSVLPHTISAYYAILGMLILQNVHAIGQSQLISKPEIRKIMKESMEKGSQKTFCSKLKFPRYARLPRFQFPLQTTPRNLQTRLSPDAHL